MIGQSLPVNRRFGLVLYVFVFSSYQVTSDRMIIFKDLFTGWYSLYTLCIQLQIIDHSVVEFLIVLLRFSCRPVSVDP